MADFCMQCSVELDAPLHWTDLSLPQSSAALRFSNLALQYCLCEGCGMIVADANGRCVDAQCSRHGSVNTNPNRLVAAPSNCSPECQLVCAWCLVGSHNISLESNPNCATQGCDCVCGG